MNIDTEKNKALVWQFLQRQSRPQLESALAQYVHDDIVWRGPQPLNELHGLAAYSGDFWRPLLRALPDLERRDYLFFGGRFDGSDWVCASGNLLGTFVDSWLGIPATGGFVNIRYGEFSRLRDGKIAEILVIFDLLDLMRQAGCWPLPPSLGVEQLIPAPATQDGLILGASDSGEAQRTLALVDAMIFDGLFKFDGVDLATMDMARFWHPDMMWYGPAGIGSTRGIDGFQRCHQGPFLRAFPDRRGGNHRARFAEGCYAASTGWPSIHCTHSGANWLGMPATGKPLTMRVMDWWRREGDYLRENWVFIDMIDVLMQIGFDVFERLAQQTPGRTSRQTPRGGG